MTASRRLPGKYSFDQFMYLEHLLCTSTVCKGRTGAKKFKLCIGFSECQGVQYVLCSVGKSRSSEQNEDTVKYVKDAHDDKYVNCTLHCTG